MDKLPLIEYTSSSYFDREQEKLLAQRTLLKLQKNMQSSADSYSSIDSDDELSFSCSDDDSTSSVPYVSSSKFDDDLEEMESQDEISLKLAKFDGDEDLFTSQEQSHLEMMFPFEDEEDNNAFDDTFPLKPAERSPTSIAEAILSPRSPIKEIFPKHIKTAIPRRENIQNIITEEDAQLSSIESIKTTKYFRIPQNPEYSVFKNPKKPYNHLLPEPCFMQYAIEHGLYSEQCSSSDSDSTPESRESDIFIDAYSEGEDAMFKMSP
jgi:hypothetical protein